MKQLEDKGSKEIEKQGERGGKEERSPNDRQRWGIISPQFSAWPQGGTACSFRSKGKWSPLEKQKLARKKNHQHHSSWFGGLSLELPLKSCRHSSYRRCEKAMDTGSQLRVICVLPLASSLAKWLRGPQWWPGWGHPPRAPSVRSVVKQRSQISPGYRRGLWREWRLALTQQRTKFSAASLPAPTPPILTRSIETKLPGFPRVRKTQNIPSKKVFKKHIAHLPETSISILLTDDTTTNICPEHQRLSWTQPPLILTQSSRRCLLGSSLINPLMYTNSTMSTEKRTKEPWGLTNEPWLVFSPVSKYALGPLILVCKDISLFFASRSLNIGRYSVNWTNAGRKKWAVMDTLPDFVQVSHVAPHGQSFVGGFNALQGNPAFSSFWCCVQPTAEPHQGVRCHSAELSLSSKATKIQKCSKNLDAIPEQEGRTLNPALWHQTSCPMTRSWDASTWDLGLHPHRTIQKCWGMDREPLLVSSDPNH